MAEAIRKSDWNATYGTAAEEPASNFARKNDYNDDKKPTRTLRDLQDSPVKLEAKQACR